MRARVRAVGPESDARKSPAHWNIPLSFVPLLYHLPARNAPQAFAGTRLERGPRTDRTSPDLRTAISALRPSCPFVCFVGNHRSNERRKAPRDRPSTNLEPSRTGRLPHRRLGQGGRLSLQTDGRSISQEIAEKAEDKQLIRLWAFFAFSAVSCKPSSVPIHSHRKQRRRPEHAPFHLTISAGQIEPQRTQRAQRFNLYPNHTYIYLSGPGGTRSFRGDRRESREQAADAVRGRLGFLRGLLCNPV